MNQRLSAKEVILYLAVGIGVLVFMVLRMVKEDDNSSSKTNIQEPQSTETNAKPKNTNTPTESPKEVLSIAEQVVYEGHDIVIKTAGTNVDWLGETEIKLMAENNSNKNLSICVHSYAVNGIMARNNMFDMNMEIASGKKSVGSFSIDSDFLKRNEITEIRNIDVLFWIYDNDKSFKDFETEIVRISTAKDNSKYDVRSGTRIYEKDGIIVESLDSNNKNEFVFMITNNNKTYVECTLDAVSINDFTGNALSYALVAEEVFPGCQCRFVIEPDEEFLTDCGIKQVDSVEFRLCIEVEGDFSKQSFTEMITREYQ